MSIKKTLYLIIMTIILCIMTLGYAALQERIDVEVEASIDSTYRVELTRVQEGTVVGDARSTSAPQYNGLNASFYVGLTNTTDSITYNIEITNYSTVDIKLNELSITVDGSNYIKASKLGISNGDIMLAGSTKNITLKVKYNGEAQSSEQTGTVTPNFNFTRLKGGVGQVVPEVYDAYEIGDKITFAGSDWYVIEDSGTDQDYVTVMKETVLTSQELTDDYAYNSGNTIGYYWNNTCHKDGRYGNETFTTTEFSNCSTSYSDSKIKLLLEESYINTLGVDNLEEINGYKIRLITTDEVINNLGWKSGVETSATTSGNAVPLWVYSANYWTMSKKNATYLYTISSNGNIGYSPTPSPYFSARPVINLYKDAIE